MSDETTETPQKITGTGKVFLWLAIGLPVLFFGGCSALMVIGSNYDTGPSESGAIAACREAVRDQLKSPASAQFSQETAADVGGDSLEVMGLVDADNTFGAPLRHGFTCTATEVGDGRFSTSQVRVERG